LIGISAFAAFLLSGMPARALNDAFQQQLQDLFDVALGVNPLGWLPNFVPLTPDWYISAYLRLVPAVLIVALFAWYGWGRRAAAALSRARRLRIPVRRCVWRDVRVS